MSVKKRLVLLSIALVSSFAMQSFAEPYYNRPTSNQTVQTDFSQYMENVKSKLQKNWNTPDFLEEGHVRIIFKLDRYGNVLGANLVESSGDSIYDESAFDALRKSEPFGEFPKQSTRETVIINYSFDTTLVKTDTMKRYYELSKQNFASDKQTSLKYINLAIAEVQGDDESYFLYKRRGKIKEALGDHLGAKEDFNTYESMKTRIDIKRVHALRHQAEVEDTAFAYYYLAYAYERIQDYDNAIWAINKAIECTDLNQQYKRYRTELIKHHME